MADEKFAAPVSYEDLLAENIRLRARIIELEGGKNPLNPEPPRRKFKAHEMDPNSEDAFRRPAYSRRTK